MEERRERTGALMIFLMLLGAIAIIAGSKTSGEDKEKE